MTTQSQDDILNRLKPIVVEYLAVDEALVTLGASFADNLEADSLDLVELTMALEEAFKITIDESELEDIVTIGDVVTLIERMLDKT